MRYFTTEILSARQELTPEGYLLCRDVPIARTGSMLYLAGEVPLEAAPDGLVTVERLPEDVFRPETIASFEGKAVTIDHPGEDVGPSNWKELAKGVAQNVRRGSALDDNFLLADLLITDAEGIRTVREDRIREVSCGYDADYQQIAPGRGRQTNIVGNHIALVEKGRCGERCAIGDSAQALGPLCATGDKAPMKKPKWFDKALAAFTARDEASLKTALEEGVHDAESESEEEKKKREADEEDKKKTSDALAALTARIGDLEKAAKDKKAKDEEAEEEERKKKQEAEKSGDKKARDSAALRDEATDVFARVEILSPGMQLPTLDAAGDATKVRDSLCALRRKALEAAFAAPKTRDAVTPLVAGKDLTKLTCDALSAAFVGASEIVRRENNAQSVQSSVTFDSNKAAANVATLIGQMNRRAEEVWNSRK